MSTNGWGGPDDWRDTEFGEGQERYYGGAPMSPSPQGERRSTPVEQMPNGGGRGRTAAIAVGAGVLAVALAGGGVFLATRSGDDPHVATSSSSDPAATQDAPSSTNEANQAANPTGPQRNSGGDSDHAAFDVPPPGRFTTGVGSTARVWKMYEDPRDQAGYGSIGGTNVSLGHAPTFYRDGFCKDDEKAGLGLFVWASAHGETPLEAASNTGDKWLKSVATRDDGKVEKYSKSPSVKNVTLGDKKTKAVQYRGKTPLTAGKQKACKVKSAEVVVTAFDTGKGTATMIAVRKLGHPDSMSDKQLNTVLDSLRPA